MATDLSVSDVLNAPAEYDHELIVRAIGPAAVLILEREAPMRLECMASTEAEFEALREWCATPRVQHLLSVYFAMKEEEERIDHSDLWALEDDHAERLGRGRRIETVRVAG